MDRSSDPPAAMNVQCDESRLAFRVPRISDEPSGSLAGTRLDSALRRHFGFGRGLLRKIRAEGGFIVNGAPARLRQPLEPGDDVRIVWPQAGSAAGSPGESPSVEPEPIPLRIVYEDRHLLAVDKPAGMLVHPVHEHRSGTLANAVSHHLIAGGQSMPKVRPLHRLDRGTSGLILFAKHPYALLRLTNALRDGRLHREYVSVVAGVVRDDAGSVDQPIRRATGSIIERETAPPGEGRAARTHFRVEARAAAHTLVRLLLETGRTHQIRVHMAAIGHPVVGDDLYGPACGRDGSGGGSAFHSIDRPALHAVRLAFPHPMSGDELELYARPPDDFAALAARVGLSCARTPPTVK